MLKVENKFVLKRYKHRTKHLVLNKNSVDLIHLRAAASGLAPSTSSAMPW
jgi:hypothetical protein